MSNHMDKPHQSTAQASLTLPRTESAELLFIVGNSRSGTTMMGRALGSHPDVFTFKELHFFEELWDPADGLTQLTQAEAILLASKLLAIQRHNYYEPGDPAAYQLEAHAILTYLKSPTPPALFRAFLKYEAARHGKTVACVQTPRNLYYLNEILQQYPRARALIMIRDPRAVLLSQKKKWRGKRTGERKFPLKHIIRTWANYHPLTISLLWRSGIQAGMRHAGQPHVKEVIFENLTRQPEPLLQEICDFAGLAYDPKMLAVPQVNSSNRANQPGKTGIDPWVAERWRQGGLRESEIRICQIINESTMVRFGYEPISTRPRPLELLLYTLTFGLKLGLAFLLNINRMRNLGPALRRRLNR